VSCSDVKIKSYDKKTVGYPGGQNCGLLFK